MYRPIFRSGRHAVLSVVAACASAVHAETWYGTAFAIGDGYTYVTNEHVVDGAKSLCFLSANDKGGKARVLSQDKADDLAILRGNLNLPPLNLSSSLKIEKGMKIYTVGYPVPTIMGLEAKVTEGIVNSLTGVRGDRRRFQVSAAIQPGNSGGPLFDENGNVLGVVVSGLGKRFTEATGYVANTVGYGIHVARLNALIETTQPLPKYVANNPLRNVNTLVKLVSQVEKSVVLVIASSESRTCESDFDVPIPEFGTVAKTRDQLQRERDDAARIARARAQIEAEERTRKEQLERGEAEERARIARARAQIEADERTRKEQIERKEAEERARREQELSRINREKIAVSLDLIRVDWREIQEFPGFKYFIKNVAEKNFTSLQDAVSNAEASKLLVDYIRWSSNSASVDVRTFDKSLLVRGRFVAAGKVSLVNSGLRFFVVDFNEPKFIWKDILILSKDGQSFSFFMPSRADGLRSSYVLNEVSNIVQTGGVVYCLAD